MKLNYSYCLNLRLYGLLQIDGKRKKKKICRIGKCRKDLIQLIYSENARCEHISVLVIHLRKTQHEQQLFNDGLKLSKQDLITMKLVQRSS